MAWSTSVSPIGDHDFRPPRVWPAAKRSEMTEPIRSRSEELMMLPCLFPVYSLTPHRIPPHAGGGNRCVRDRLRTVRGCVVATTTHDVSEIDSPADWDAQVSERTR